MNEIVNTSAETESIARFQTLQAGQYWRSLRAIVEEGIDEATVLLIQSIRWVDNAPHTIILRPHPSKIGSTTYLEIPQEDGSARRSYFKYDEHRFLLDDFLALFEFEPDHQRVRNEELQRVQGKINSLQGELMEAQSNPAVLAAVVEAGLKEKPKSDGDETDEEEEDDGGSGEAPEDTAQANSPALPVPAAPARSGQELAIMATGTVSAAIGVGITAEGIAALKSAASREHQIATIKAKWIQGKTGEIAETIKAMTPFYQEQAAAALAQTEDVRSYVAKLMEGIESLDLYVGKDVEVHTIRTGDSAPKDVPLTFVQKKLMMDEELAVWADIDSWFDFGKEEKFFEALRQHDSLVNQIFPTERCVLVMATTRRYINYGDTYTNMARNDRNKEVFLLIRDGMNIHRVFSSVESHLGTARLFPSKDDQDRVFQGMHGEHIKFEDVAYTDRLAAHEKFALHYKRFLLLVCGLDHRLKLFGDFYEGPQSLHFVSMAFQERYCRFLHDDDGTNLLPGEARQPLNEWIAEKNSYLRSGARVLCKWIEVMNPTTAPGACKPYSRGDGYDRRYAPKNEIDFVIAYKDGDSFCVDIEVSGYSYSSHADRTFNCKVNLTKLKESRYDREDLPFLCLDAVSAEELHWYIHNRPTRVQHLSYIRFFKEALRFIQREQAGEHDTRERMAQALAVGGIATGEDATDIIQQAVIAWRAANRGKPLPSFENGVAPAAWTSLLDQMYMLAGEGKRRVDDIAAFVNELGYAPLRLVLSGGAKLVVYASPSAHERDDRIEDHAWVHRIMVEKGKTKYVEKSRRWALLPKSAASETTVHQWDAAKDWAGLNPVFETFERKQKLLDLPSRFIERLKPFSGRPMDSAAFNSAFDDWKEFRGDLLRDSKFVQNPRMAIPFGVMFHPRGRILNYLCVGAWNPHAILRDQAPSDAAREQLKAAFIKAYGNKSKGLENFNIPAGWQLLEVEVSLADTERRYGPFFHYSMGTRGDALDGAPPASPLLSDWLDGRMAKSKKDDGRTKFWFADGAIDSMGRLVLDEMLGIDLPEDFDPVRVVSISLHAHNDDQERLYTSWYDICRDTGEDNDSGFWPGRSDTTKELIEQSTPADAFKWSTGYGSQGFHETSPESARTFICSKVANDTDGAKRAVMSTALPDAPQPPAGVERWYVIEAANG